MSECRVPPESSSPTLSLATALADASLGLFAVDENSVVTASNLAFARMCRPDITDAAHVVEHKLTATPSFHQLLEAASQGPTVVTIELRGADTSQRCTALLWAQRTTDSTRLHGMLLRPNSGAETDDVQALRSELAFMTRVAGTLAHDFNNLLTVIMSVGELMLLSGELGANLVQRTQTLIAATQRAACLSTQLTHLTHQPKVTPSRLPAEKLLQSVTQCIRQLVPELALRTWFAPEPCYLRLDLEPLAQILVQLVLHLRDSLPPECPILVSMRRVQLLEGLPPTLSAGAYVEFTLASDDHPECSRPGLAMELLTNAGASPRHASGLGLTSAQDIVAHVGGHVGLLFRDKGPPLFVVYLPQDLA